MTKRTLTRAQVQIPSLPLQFVDLQGKKDEPAPTMLNTRIAIQRMGLDCRYDIFHDRYLIEGSAFGNSALQLSDAVARKLRESIRLAYKFDPGKDNAMDALYRACEENQFHPILDYLDSLRWDGKPRVDTWLIDYMQAEDTPFNRAVSRLILIASVRRIRAPGMKFDHMVVLHSPEGYGKSSALTTLYGKENFTDQTILGVSDKELQEALRGRWCVECSELVGLRRSEIERVKSVITREADRARPAYGRAVVEIPRSVVIWGTTNDEQYLRALSGENRRFLPVSVGRIDQVALRLDRDQLWAEASALEPQEESLSLPADLWPAASEARSMRTQSDPWSDELELLAQRASRDARSGYSPIYSVGKDKSGNSEHRVSSTYILTDVLGIPVDRQTSEHAKRANQVLQSLGWRKPATTIRIGGRPIRGYTRPVEPWD